MPWCFRWGCGCAGEKEEDGDVGVVEEEGTRGCGNGVRYYGLMIVQGVELICLRAPYVLLKPEMRIF